MAFLFPLSLVFLDLIFFFAFLLNAFFFTVLSLSPLNVIFLILLSPINALELIVLTAFPITTVSSFEQFLNAFFPITVFLRRQGKICPHHGDKELRRLYGRKYDFVAAGD